VKTFKSKRFN